jgi:hypothetical protein
MPVRQIDNPIGAFGLPVTKGHQVVAEFQAGSTATIEASRVVAVAADGTITKAATNASQVACVGITTDEVVARNGVAGTGTVCVHGVVRGVPYTGTAPNFGDLLTRSSQAAGAVMVQAATGAGQIGSWIGFCAGGVDTVSATCDVYVTKL